MNPDSTSSASTGPQASQRVQRGAIAVQACDTCRNRKQKCDEQRPKCGLCQRMNLECTYREPQPTKKDKTLVEILDRLKIIEGKVDRIPMRPLPLGGFPLLSQSSVSLPPSPYTANSVRPSQRASPSGRSQPYRHASAAHKMLTWPAIQTLLSAAVPNNVGDLRSIELEGSAFVVRVQQGVPTLPLDEFLLDQPFVGMQMQATRTAGGPRVIFPDLDYDTMHKLATVYFDTFNLIYPFMDRQNFIADTLMKVHTEGFNGDTDSVIALLVFALGEVAQQGTQGNPIDTHNGRPSGVRGGTAERPPGLALFNEARKRIGFVLTECDLENVQIFSLTALYYESCSHHLDFWRLTVSASLACQVLITCNSIDWTTQRGDLIKRAYWHCVVMETGLHLELDLPLTGIIAFEESIDLPSFNSPFCESDHRSNIMSHFEKHYASQIALRRLCANLHNDINDSMSTSADTPGTSNEDFGGPSTGNLKQLASQLDQWRNLLPVELQWPENEPTLYPPLAQVSKVYDRKLDPSLATLSRSQSATPLFTTDLDQEPKQYPYVYDIQVALLRTRYYYAKYMAHRPFIYKALHFPDQMTSSDAQGVAVCLKSCLKWPITLSPTSRRKRLIPYLFCWSQNFLGILLILHLTQHIPLLRHIRSEMCGDRFEADVAESIDLMLDWIRDLKSIDPMAAWCWQILQRIYDVE